MKSLTNKAVRAIALSSIGLLVACSTPAANDVALPAEPSSADSDAAMVARIEQIRERHGLPALGVLVQSNDHVRLLAVTGVRKEGEPEPATPADMWHIGSNTKAMTATLVATFVSDGSVGFDTRVVELFPELSSQLSAGADSITVEQVLRHQAGFAANPFNSLDEYMAAIGDAGDVGEQRRRVLERALTQPLLFPPGSDTSYSNTGFIVAGAIAERLGGSSWESLLQQRVLVPLGIVHAGFGAPGTSASLDQPWGHRPVSGGLIPVAPDDQEHQNPPLFGPAGSVHLSLSDWALFATEHVAGRRGLGKLLDQGSYERLHTAPGGESGIAMGFGALVEQGETTMLAHNGSDGNWFAELRIYLETDTTYLLVTNDGREDGEARLAFAEVRAALNERYEPFPN